MREWNRGKQRETKKETETEQREKGETERVTASEILDDRRCTVLQSAEHRGYLGGADSCNMDAYDTKRFNISEADFNIGPSTELVLQKRQETKRIAASCDLLNSAFAKIEENFGNNTAPTAPTPNTTKNPTSLSPPPPITITTPTSSPTPTLPISTPTPTAFPSPTTTIPAVKTTTPISTPTKFPTTTPLTPTTTPNKVPTTKTTTALPNSTPRSIHSAANPPVSSTIATSATTTSTTTTTKLKKRKIEENDDK
eukprot:m.194526 g.194526  ORF g.194526 m.194526 type:complete len:254 (-) comp32534_c1_seq1:51-812(-)